MMILKAIVVGSVSLVAIAGWRLYSGHDLFDAVAPGVIVAAILGLGTALARVPRRS